MLTPRLIPCLDVRDGRVVKGINFQNLRNVGDPVDFATKYEASGADEIVMLDVSATSEHRSAALNTVRALRRVLSIPLTVGGGVRSESDASALLDAGADKVALNTASVQSPILLTRLANRFGCQCIVQAIDAKRLDTGSSASGWTVFTHAGTRDTNIDAVDFARSAAGCGAGELLLTSIDHDGTGSGFDIPLLRAIAGIIDIPVIASGGGRTPQHLAAALDAGASAVLVATILHDGHNTVASLKQSLQALNVKVRA